MNSSSAAPTTTGASGATALKTASNAALGTILVTPTGATIYRFDADSTNPPTSHCTGSCASIWPPVPAPASLTAQGIPQSELGTITRSDGTKQLTVAGWPVYTYTGDAAAGQANGEHLNVNGGTWWAVTTTGARASASPGAPSASASGTGGVQY
jgi:predicted lipoprotein with Yx(FWY)xxD motif